MLHTWNLIIQEIIINFMTACILDLKNDTLCQSSEIMMWVKLSTRANAWQNPNSISQNYEHKNIRQKKELARESNCFSFIVHCLGVESLMMVLEWYRRGRLLSFNHTRNCTNPQSPFPGTTFLQKGSSSGFRKLPKTSIQI